MKKLLFILFVTVGFTATAQQRDTVKVFAMASDTSLCKAGVFVGQNGCVGAFWCLKIRERHNPNEDLRIAADCHDWEFISHAITIGYLDIIHKQPLNPNIIIWQSVEAK